MAPPLALQLSTTPSQDVRDMRNKAVQQLKALGKSQGMKGFEHELHEVYHLDDLDVGIRLFVSRLFHGRCFISPLQPTLGTDNSE